MEMSAAFIAMPGSIGTLAELMVAWNLAFVAPLSAREFGPVIAVGDPWRQIVPELITALSTDGGLVYVVDTPEEAVAIAREQLPAK